MSKLSLYENNWINLVFENKNKEYGAFQLRQETTKTSFHALFIGVLLCTAIISLPSLLRPSKEITVPKVPVITDRIIELTNIYTEKNKETAAVLPEIKAQTPTEAIDKKQLINPIVVSTPQATPELEFTLQNTNSTDSTTDGIAIAGLSSGTRDGVANGTGNGNGTDIGTDNTSAGSAIVINELLDTKPQFPGGIEKFYRYIGNNFNSPTLDENKNIRIFISFVVEKDGSMSNIKVMNNPGVLLEKEAIRVLKSIKAKWTPGILHSKPVRTAYNLPIMVQVD